MNQMRDLRSISRRYRRYFRTKLRALFSKRELTLEPLDLNEATREVIALSSNDLQRNRIILQSELTDDIPIVTGDRLDSLFEAFYTTKSGGMGIGLFVSRSIVERHEGVRRFQLSSSPLTKMGPSVRSYSRAVP